MGPFVGHRSELMKTKLNLITNQSNECLARDSNDAECEPGIFFWSFMIDLISDLLRHIKLSLIVFDTPQRFPLTLNLNVLMTHGFKVYRLSMDT